MDHDHKTGLNRGILCRSCNLGIGFLRDDFKLCNNAASYLEKDRSEAVLLLEADRCREMIEALDQEIVRLPKGSLHKRIKTWRESVYEYHYFKYRHGGKVFSKHIASNDVDLLSAKLRRRKALCDEREVYKIRLKQIFYKGEQKG